MSEEKKPDFILLRNNPEELGTISNISNILRIFGGYENDDDHPYKLYIQYDISPGNSSTMQRTQLSFKKQEKRDEVHKQLQDILEPIIFDVPNALDSIM